MKSMYPKNPMPQARTATDPSPPTPSKRGRRLQVRRSGIHGKGVFAVAPIARGELVIE